MLAKTPLGNNLNKRVGLSLPPVAGVPLSAGPRLYRFRNDAQEDARPVVRPSGVLRTAVAHVPHDHPAGHLPDPRAPRRGHRSLEDLGPAEHEDAGVREVDVVRHLEGHAGVPPDVVDISRLLLIRLTPHRIAAGKSFQSPCLVLQRPPLPAQCPQEPHLPPEVSFRTTERRGWRQPDKH